MALACPAKNPATDPGADPAKPRRASSPPPGTGVESDTPDLSISREKVCFIVIKARIRRQGLADHS
jgi:hypothetical protein